MNHLKLLFFLLALPLFGVDLHQMETPMTISAMAESDSLGNVVSGGELLVATMNRGPGVTQSPTSISVCATDGGVVNQERLDQCHLYWVIKKEPVDRCGNYKYSGRRDSLLGDSIDLTDDWVEVTTQTNSGHCVLISSQPSHQWLLKRNMGKGVQTFLGTPSVFRAVFQNENL